MWLKKKPFILINACIYRSLRYRHEALLGEARKDKARETVVVSMDGIARGDVTEVRP